MKKIVGYSLLVALGYIGGIVRNNKKIAQLDDKYSHEISMIESALQHYDNILNRGNYRDY